MAGASLEITDIEQRIFDILTQTVAYQQKSTILRAAGGWVRDKLLGLPSDDIDIAIDNQSGSAFATAVNEYLLTCGLETHTIAVIHANPEQSKHLETARLKILNLELDFVNLRTESYTSHSRIPTIGEDFGTPLDDALRRDFTINSLFYNLQTKQIEDFTGHGLQDLQNGLIRTPLDPSITFTDDPLRLLRAIRFSSRFHYRLHDSIREIACQSEIHDALHLKVSKERQLKEISGCFSGQLCRPVLAISTLHSFGLFATVFTLPDRVLLEELQPEMSNSLYRTVDELIQRWEYVSIQCSNWMNCLLQVLLRLSASSDPTYLPLSVLKTPLQSLDSCASLVSSPLILPLEIVTSPMHDIVLSAMTLNTTEAFWAACVSGFAGINVKEKKGKPLPLCQFVLRESLKLDNDTLKAVSLSLQAARFFQKFSQSFPPSLEGFSVEEISDLRETLGLALRDGKHHWRMGLILACSLDLSLNSPPISIDSPVEFAPYHLEAVERYRRIESTIVSFNLDGVWLMKPHYDGDALVQELQMKRGPQLGKIIEKQFRWQLRYPDRRKEECLAHLREELGNL